MTEEGISIKSNSKNRQRTLVKWVIVVVLVCSIGYDIFSWAWTAAYEHGKYVSRAATAEEAVEQSVKKQFAGHGAETYTYLQTRTYGLNAVVLFEVPGGIPANMLHYWYVRHDHEGWCAKQGVDDNSASWLMVRGDLE